MSALVEVLIGWPIAASIAVVAVHGLRVRRRVALNEALHELRRPLQALALQSTSPGGGGEHYESSMRLVSVALRRLDDEINGVAPDRAREELDLKELIESVVGRWRQPARRAGKSLDLRWRTAPRSVVGERASLEQALENLVVNAVLHGRPRILVEVGASGKWLRVDVVDSGWERWPRSGPAQAAGAVDGLTGRRRHGHGLAVVRRVARGHGGTFVFRRSSDRTLARLELPLARVLGAAP